MHPRLHFYWFTTVVGCRRCAWLKAPCCVDLLFVIIIIVIVVVVVVKTIIIFFRLLYIFFEEEMSVPENLHPTHKGKILTAMKAMCAVKWITFNRTEANPVETLYDSVPKLNENEVLMPGSLAPRFDILVTKGHASSFLVKNVAQTLVDKLIVKFTGTILRHDVYKPLRTFPCQRRQRGAWRGTEWRLSKIRGRRGAQRLR